MGLQGHPKTVPGDKTQVHTDTKSPSSAHNREPGDCKWMGPSSGEENVLERASVTGQCAQYKFVKVTT